MNDDQLLQMLDEQVLWLVRGGSVGVLGHPCDTLGKALQQAYDFSMQGKAPGPIQMSDGNVIVPADQIYRLWRSLGFTVR